MLFFLIIASLLGLFLPHPIGLLLVGLAAVAAISQLEGRIARLEGRMDDQVGPEETYEGAEGYNAEKNRIRRKMARYASEAEKANTKEDSRK